MLLTLFTESGSGNSQRSDAVINQYVVKMRNWVTKKTNQRIDEVIQGDGSSSPTKSPVKSKKISRFELTKEITDWEKQEQALKKQLIKYLVTKFMKKADTQIKNNKEGPIDLRIFVLDQYMTKVFSKL
jgi:hypothetical protein